MQVNDFDTMIKNETETASIQEIESAINVKFKTKSKLTSLVKPSQLKIDMSYQREVDYEKVRYIVKNYNENAIGVLTLSMRENGDIYIIDGSHRVEVLHRLGKSDNDVNAIVFFNLTLKEEAELYISINQIRTKPKKTNLHKASVSSGNSDSISIDAVLRKNGLRIDNKPGDGIIRAVDAIYKINSKIGSDKLDSVIKVLKDANGSSSTSFQSEYLIAVATIISNYKNINLPRLTSAISYLGDPTTVIHKAKSSARGTSPFFRMVSLCLIIIDRYNYKLKSNKLDTTVIMTLDKRKYLGDSE